MYISRNNFLTILQEIRKEYQILVELQFKIKFTCIALHHTHISLDQQKKKVCMDLNDLKGLCEVDWDSYPLFLRSKMIWIKIYLQ